MIRIIEVTNPFEPKQRTITYVKATNETVYHYVKDVDEKQCFLNGVPIENPAHCFPQDGNELVVVPKITGHTFKKWFGVIATIGLAFVGAHIAGLGIWGKTLAGKMLGGLAAGLVMSVGGKVINSVFGLNRAQGFNLKDKDTESNTYGWDLPSVQTTEGGVIGETYGECIPSPQLLMEHVETVNNEQYLNLLLCGGWGPVDSIYNVRIGNTDIANFQNVQMETRLGENDQTAIGFLNDLVSDQSVSVELRVGSPVVRTTTSSNVEKIEVTVEFPSGLYSISDKGDTRSNTARFRLEYRKKGESTWHGAGVRVTTNVPGHITNISVPSTATSETWTLSAVYEDRYVTVTGRKRKRKVRTEEKVLKGWSVIGNVHGNIGVALPNDNFNSQYISFRLNGDPRHKVSVGRYETGTISVYNGEHDITASSTTAIRRTVSVGGLEVGQYDVRMTALSLPSSSRMVSYMQWTLLSSYIADNNYTRPGKVLVGLRIKATNQLSGSLPQVNWRQSRSTVYVWNPNENKYEAKDARNPIWAAYDILHGCKYLKNINTGEYEYVVNGSPKENFVDFYDEWVKAAAYADEEVSVVGDDDLKEPRFRFDAFFDTSDTRWNAAQKAAAVGHAAILRHGTQYGISVDMPGEIVQIFGEGRTIKDSFTGKFASRSERARAVEITYNDSESDFKNTVFLYRSPTYAADLTKQDNTAKETLFGVKSRSQAYREAVYYMACNERQLQTIEFSADVNAVVCEYGDIIGINHSVPDIGKASGRIAAVNGNNVKLDRPVTLEAGKQYSIMVSLPDDTIVTRDIVSAEAETTTDTVQVSLAFEEGKIPAQYDNYAIGTVDKVVKPYRVTKIVRDGDLKLKISGIEYDEAVYALNYDQFPFIDYTDEDTALEAPENLQLSECNYTTQEGSKVRNIVARWEIPNSRLIYTAFRVSYSVDNGKTWISLPTVAGTETQFTYNVPNIDYLVRVCGVADGVQSPYVLGKITPTGIDVLPPDVSAINVEKMASGLRRYWWQFDYPTPNDIAGFRIKYTQGGELNWDNGIPVQSGLITDQPYETQMVRQGTHAVMIKAVDNAGNESQNFAHCILDLGDLLEENVLVHKNFHTDNWAGTTYDGVLLGDGYIHAKNDTYMWTSPTDYMWSGQSEYKWKSHFLPYELIATFTAEASGQMWLRYVISGPAIVYYRKAMGTPIWKQDDMDTPVWKKADMDTTFWTNEGTFWKQYSDRVMVRKGELIQVRVHSLNNTKEETVIQELEALIDVPDRNEHFEDLEIPADGRELPIVTPYYKTTAVHLDAIQGTAADFRLLSRTPCVVQLLDDSGSPVAGSADISWQGYEEDRL